MRFLPLLSLVLLSACSPTAEKAAYAIVEKIAGQVGFYTAEGKRIAGVKVGEHPHEIILSPDHKYLYVSDNGILWMQYAGEGGNTISIIDVASMKKAGVIDLGDNRRPHGLDIHAATGRMLSTTENPDGLLLIDPVARKVLRRYDVKGEDPHMVLFDKPGEHAYVSNSTSNTVAVVNLQSGAVKLIPTGKRPQGGVLSADGRTIYLTTPDSNQIAIIDTAKQEQTGAVPTSPGPARVALTPDGQTLVYNLSDGVGFADVSTRKELKTVPIGGLPLSLTLSRDGKLAFLGIQDQDRIVVVSVDEPKILREFKTPKEAGPDPVLALP